MKRASSAKKNAAGAPPAKRPRTVAAPKPSGGGGNPFWMLQNRVTPPHLGMKPLPVGKPWCLWGKVFLCTGVLDSIERDDAFKLVEHYGGKVAKSVTKTLTHAIIGTDAGAKKQEQIEARKEITILNEDSFFELIRSLPAQRPAPPDIEKFNKQRKTKGEPVRPTPTETAAPLAAPATPTPRRPQEDEAEAVSELWVDKYRPSTSAEIIGNSGAVQKLREWLRGWHRTTAPMPVPNDPKGKGKGKATAPVDQRKNSALLSGPPGIGKTTAAHMIAKECGFNIIEYNASDVRTKKMVKEQLSQSTESRSLSEFFGTGASSERKRTVLIMDEVDGMSTGDTGGVSEIVDIIKKTRMPIICLCNDRSSKSIKTLAGHCLDIQLWKPSTQQIYERVAQILQREKIDISADKLMPIIDSSGGDMRQLLNMLQMLTTKTKDIGKLSAEELQERLTAGLKEAELKPFDSVSRLFSPAERQKLSTSDKLDLYFIDTSFVPLFIHENYLNCKSRVLPSAGRDTDAAQMEELERASRAADSISDGDLFDAGIHRDQDWGLQPYHGIASTVCPVELVRGSLPGRINFPQCLGKLSSGKRRKRELRELSTRSNLGDSRDTSSARLDCLPFLAKMLSLPLVKRGAAAVEDVIRLMDACGITRDDQEIINELTDLFDPADPVKTVPPNVKAALTRRWKSTRNQK